MTTVGWNDADETIVGGSGEVYHGAVGATAPTNESSSLAPATWAGLGYHTEDGLAFAFAPEVQRFGAWQSIDPIRIERQGGTFRLTFALLQWNEETLKVAFGGGTVTDLTGGHYRYTPPANTDALTERAFVADVMDGSKVGRFYVPRGVAVEGVDGSFSRSAMAALPVTIEALTPPGGGEAWSYLSNSAGFAAGS